MDYTIRKAKNEDVSILNNFLTLLIHDEKKYDSNINLNYVVNSYYENFISDDKNCLLVALKEEEIIGYLFGYLEDNGDVLIDKVTKLDALFVSTEFRKLGIAKYLINEFKKWSIEIGARYIEVNVCNGNTKAISLYKKEGFREIKTTLELELE